MRAIARLVGVVGVVGIALGLSGTVSTAEAQHGNCIACVWNGAAAPPDFECWAGSQIGWSTCYILQGSCVTGTQCGLYRPVGDGTVAKLGQPSTAGTRLAPTRSASLASLRSTALPIRFVERGCDGAVVQRKYSKAAARELRENSKAISL